MALSDLDRDATNDLTSVLPDLAQRAQRVRITDQGEAQVTLRRIKVQ